MLPAADKEFFKEHAKTLVQFIPFVVLGAVAPGILMVCKFVDAKWFVLGPVTWMLAVGIKSVPVLVGMFYFPSAGIRNIYTKSILEGLLSAAAELGLTIWFFLYYYDRELSVHRIFSFGLGIGFAEVLFILYMLIEDIEKLTPEVKTKKKFVLWPQLIERTLTIGLHVFSRAIIGLSILQHSGYAFAVLAFLVFAFMDGFGGFIAVKWNLEKRSALTKVYGLLLLFVLILGVICFSYYDTKQM